MEKKKMIKWAAIAAPIIVMMIIISQPRKKNQEYYNPVLSATAQKKEEAQGRGEYLFVEDKAKENALIQDKTNLPAPKNKKKKARRRTTRRHRHPLGPQQERATQPQHHEHPLLRPYPEDGTRI